MSTAARSFAPGAVRLTVLFILGLVLFPVPTASAQSGEIPGKPSGTNEEETSPVMPVGEPVLRRLIVHGVSCKPEVKKVGDGITICADIEAEGFKGKKLTGFVSFILPGQKMVPASSLARPEQKDERGLFRHMVSKKIGDDRVRTDSLKVFVPWRILKLPPRAATMTVFFCARCGKFRSSLSVEIALPGVEGDPNAPVDEPAPLRSLRVRSVRMLQEEKTELGRCIPISVEVFPSGLEGKTLFGAMRLRRLRGGFAKPCSGKSASGWTDGLGNFCSVAHGVVKKEDAAGKVFKVYLPCELVELERDSEWFALELSLSCDILNSTIEMETVVTGS
jgi:hypothetical protein